MEVGADVSYLSPRFIIRSDSPEREVEEYARAHDWPKVLDVPEDLESGDVRSIEWEITGGARLKFFQDDVTDCPYFFIEAPYSNLCLSMTRHAVAEIPVCKRDELLNAFDVSEPGSEERCQAILMAALGASHELDVDVYRRIGEALGDPNADVRSAAVYAMSYSPASEYVPALRETAVGDTDGRVREEAQELLDVFAQIGIGDA
ncbi:HEAT repeat-containing protein [Streptomyces radiopugnans]|uniref:HEAT repeat-containing protein n=1 Tax=Streptomyces radiopugnans TaxID=403935 RepID=A0A1H9FNG5_9ACTN|nr:HEAT repeat-containing protein [Streptomyces radiopugnans]